ncbi:MAG: amidophosphoribosyltransferase [Candidatus Micrarchaeota archaeon]
MKNEKTECCGVVGACAKNGANIAPVLYRAMISLQHRGQDASGFIIWGRKEDDNCRSDYKDCGNSYKSDSRSDSSNSNDCGFIEKKGIGLVANIFDQSDLNTSGSIGIGHTRYPTTGLCMMSDVQPFKSNGIAVSHNGQISNYKIVRKDLEARGYKFISSVDSEVVVYMLHEMLYAIPHEMNEKQSNKKDVRKDIGRDVRWNIGKDIRDEDIENAVMHVMKMLDGAYSITALIKDTLIAFKDPSGIRPLVWGENKDFIVFASESVALDINGIRYKGELVGGELAIIRNGEIKIKRLVNKVQRACMFEYVYFSRPDSVINKKLVMDVRKNLGRILAREHPVNADVVIDVPDSARTAASEYARVLGIPHKEGLIKNRYIGRTFIMPAQEKRITAVRMKLNVVRQIVAGKRVVLIDDSIVRGTTLKEIVSLVKNAGATKVHVRITCPPIRAPCFYGIDMSTYSELAAHKRTVSRIGKIIGAHSLGYISLEGLKEAVGSKICIGCLIGKYPTPYAKKLADKKLVGNTV